MKKSRRLLFLAFFLMIGIGIFTFTQRFNHKSITKVLETKPYSYLSNEAKEYIKDVYEESGEIVLTEKNKEENKPYLNPKYVEYLEKSEEEQQAIELVPTPFVFEYSDTIDKQDATLPSTYDLRNVNGNSYVTPIKDQGSLNLCWSFTTIEQIESLLMVKNRTPYNANTSTMFSTRFLDYASSTNGITDYYNDYGTRLLTEGGNFLTSTIVAYNGLGLMNDSYMPFNYSTSTQELSTILNYSNSLYEVNSTIRVPMLTQTSTSTQRSSFVNTVKQLVMENGGAYVGTQGPGYSCSVDVGSGSALIRFDDGCLDTSGHAMQIIGWNDNYTYSYCKNTTTKMHTANTSNCNGTVVNGRGAWILRNSWGSSYPYVYLAYDSYDDDVYVFTNVSSMQKRNWDNNYHKEMDSFQIYYGSGDTQYFVKSINTREKVQKVKFFAFGQNGTYKISVNSNSQAYNNIKTVTVAYPGIYTVDLSDKNVIIDGEEFSVSIESTNGIPLVQKSMTAFTSNVDTTPVIQSSIDSIELNKLTYDYTSRLYSYTKNIPSNSNITYQLFNSNNENVSNYISVSNRTVSKNDVNASLIIYSSIPVGAYTLKLSYQSATEEIPVLIGKDMLFTIKYYANGGTGTMSNQTSQAFSNIYLNANAFTREGYTFSKWNTAQDGSGTDYEDQVLISSISSNLDLYAQWNPISYSVAFNGNSGYGTMNNQTFTYDVAQKLKTNRFYKYNHVFTGWNTKADGTGTSYENEETVSNLSKTANETITLYAQWQRVQEYVTIHYDANGGEGTIEDQSVHSSTSVTLEENVFTREGYTFTGWNTKADGSGTSYSDQQVISQGFLLDVTLYAQWSPITYYVIFNANEGTGSMQNQSFVYDTTQELRENQFTREGYTFTGWNTKADGSGDSYEDRAGVRNLAYIDQTIVFLYAQWEEKPPFTYEITHYSVNETKHYIDLIETNTSLSKYRSYFTLGDGYTLSIDLGSNSYIYSGSVAKIKYNGQVVATYTNIVRGDINGDGKMSALDYVAVKNHIMGSSTITNDVFKTAADANKDNKVSALDYVQIKNYIMNGG